LPYQTQAHYDGKNICEWNIDGYNEHNIINKLQKRTVTATTYKFKNQIDKK
jgi:hypothetical protein